MKFEEFTKKYQTKVKDNEIWLVPQIGVKNTASIFKKAEARLITITAFLESDLEIGIYYHFEICSLWQKNNPNIRSKVFNVFYKTKKSKIDSVTSIYPGADFIEKEISEMYGVNFIGHVDKTNLLLTEKIETPLLAIEKKKKGQP